MLIEFSVANYRSFREKQTFSMVAAARLQKKDNVFKPDVPGERLPALLKVAAIYGPNASGKSNLIKALGLISLLCRREPKAINSDKLPVSPFRFDPDLLNKPTELEVHFIANNQRYQFKVSLTEDRIIEESLIAYPRGVENIVYSRKHTDNGDVYETPHLEGSTDLHKTWEKLTGAQTLFISQVLANSSEDLQQLRPPFNWLHQSMLIIPNGMRAWAEPTQRLAKDNPSFADSLSNFLQLVDVPVTNIYFEDTEDRVTTPGSDLLQENAQVIKSAKTKLTHKTSLGVADFDFNEESEGTKALIGFWLPWGIMQNKNNNSNYRALVVDELDSSLHPEIVANLVQNHIKCGATNQLIFSTHDTHLMNTKLLRRDQFWIVERGHAGDSQLRSIHDFSGREGEDIEKRYYENRYLGLPFLRKMDK